MHSKQKFRFEVQYSIRLMEKIEEGENTKEKLADCMGIGMPKIQTYCEWLVLIDAIEIKDSEIRLTKLGKSYLKLKYSDDLLEPLMLYHLLRNPEEGENQGHFYFSKIVTEVLYDYIFSYDNTLTVNKIRKTLGIEEKEFIASTLNTLCDADTGFGKMGLVEKGQNMGGEDQYEIHSYWIEPLIGAYILYDLWKPNQVAMGIDKIINDKYNLGRFFLMDEDAVIETLEEIQNLKLINIEKIAGLNQIRIDQNISKEDILNKIIEIS
ncbi:DUF4007 family protein [Cetobacterium ceti]